MISVKATGDFSNTTKFLSKMKSNDAISLLNTYGQKGVSLLSKATPSRTGLTASSWSYDVSYSSGRYEIHWKNSNINNGVNIAMIIQYGHGTRRGGYVQGIDYINPVMEQLFADMANELWREVTSK